MTGEEELVALAARAMERSMFGPQAKVDDPFGYVLKAAEAAIAAIRPAIEREAEEKLLREFYKEVKGIDDYLAEAGRRNTPVLKWRNLMTRIENLAKSRNIDLTQGER